MDLQWIKDGKRVGTLVYLKPFNGKEEWKYEFRIENVWGETAVFKKTSEDYQFCLNRMTFEMNHTGAEKYEYDPFDLNDSIEWAFL